MSQIELSKDNIGEGFEAYISKVKKGYMGLTLQPSAMRTDKKGGKDGKR